MEGKMRRALAACWACCLCCGRAAGAGSRAGLLARAPCRGRVLASYSCELNYWNYARPEDVGEWGPGSARLFAHPLVHPARSLQGGLRGAPGQPWSMGALQNAGLQCTTCSTACAQGSGLTDSLAAVCTQAFPAALTSPRST